MEIEVVAPNEQVAVKWAQEKGAKVRSSSFVRSVRRWHDTILDVDNDIMGSTLGEIQSIFKLDVEGGEFEDSDEGATIIPNRTRLRIIEQEVTA